MHIEITARHSTLSDALRSHVSERFGHALRLADDVTSIHVILDHERTRQSAEVVVHGRNLAAAVHADGEDHFVAVDRCADKLRHQLEHHLGRRRDKRRRSPGLAAAEAEAAAAALAAAQAGEEPVAPSAVEAPKLPGIRRTSLTDLPKRTVDEARAEMESMRLACFAFREARSESLSILVRRSDGDLDLFDNGAA